MTAAIDLIPASFHGARRRRDRQRVYVAAIVISGAIIGAVGMHASRRASQVNRLIVQADRLRADTDALNQNRVALAAELEAGRRMLHEVESLRYGHRWSRVLSFLAECVPDSALLVLVATDPAEPGRTASARRAGRNAGASPADAVQDPRAIALRGYVLEHQDLAAFLGRLKEQQVFHSVSLLHSKREPFLNGEGIAFTLTCHW